MVPPLLAMADTQVIDGELLVPVRLAGCPIISRGNITFIAAKTRTLTYVRLLIVTTGPSCAIAELASRIGIPCGTGRFRIMMTMVPGRACARYTQGRSIRWLAARTHGLHRGCRMFLRAGMTGSIQAKIIVLTRRTMTATLSMAIMTTRLKSTHIQTWRGGKCTEILAHLGKVMATGAPITGRTMIQTTAITGSDLDMNIATARRMEGTGVTMATAMESIAEGTTLTRLYCTLYVTLIYKRNRSNTATAESALGCLSANGRRLSPQTANSSLSLSVAFNPQPLVYREAGYWSLVCTCKQCSRTDNTFCSSLARTAV